MMKWSIIAVVTLLMAFSSHSTLEAKPAPGRVYVTRVTAANFRSIVNCEGKNLRKLSRIYGNICAVEQGTIRLYSRVYIPEINQTYTVIDYIPRSSTRKHERRAARRGIDLELCIDRYKDVPKRELKHYDLGITEVKAEVKAIK